MSEFFASITPWLQEHGLRALFIIIVVFLIMRFSRMVIERVIRKLVVPDRHSSKEAEQKREETLIRICVTTMGIGVWILAGLMILAEFGVEIGPLLAAAGVAGLALGFGGQYLIRDLITGLFMLLENQYRMGDVVCFDGTCGLVEDITLRMTTLRDLDGTVHHIPHGTITKVSNLSKDFARVNMDIGISYEADLEKVIKVINKVGEEMAKDAYWRDFIVKPMEFLRVNDFADSAIMIKILGDTKPLKQWDVAGEFRKRLKMAFDKEGIEIPYPQRVIYQKKG